MIILASQSPRRREIMEHLGQPFKVCPSSASEDIPLASPEEYVTSLALIKARAVAAEHPGDTVIAADTVVLMDGKILGKPSDASHARAYLHMLSGRTHRVYTGVAVARRGEIRTFHEETDVTFRPLPESLIEEYVRSGEPMDKAGAYGIQGLGGRFVKGIRGDFYNVMGLPLCALSEVLEDMGVLDPEGGE